MKSLFLVFLLVATCNSFARAEVLSCSNTQAGEFQLKYLIVTDADSAVVSRNVFGKSRLREWEFVGEGMVDHPSSEEMTIRLMQSRKVKWETEPAGACYASAGANYYFDLSKNSENSIVTVMPIIEYRDTVECRKRPKFRPLPARLQLICKSVAL